MRRPLVKMTALALALMPVAAFAQNPPAQPPPAPPATQQPATPAQPPSPAVPAAPVAPGVPKLTFKTNAGMLLVQVKPDQTAAFEEMIAKLRTSVATSADAAVKQQGNLKAYKSSEAAGTTGNVLYVVLYDPATPGAEHYWLDVVNKTLTPDQQRDPATREMYTKWAGSIATMNQLNLTVVGGGM